MAFETAIDPGFHRQGLSNQCFQFVKALAGCLAQSFCPYGMRKPQIGSYNLKNKRFLICTMILLTFLESPYSAVATEKNAFKEMHSLSTDCIHTSQASACRGAKILAEVLQRQAASIGNHGCQSRLLGLGADLLMIDFKSGRGGAALNMLKEVKMFCVGL